MWDRFITFLRAPVFEGDEEKTNNARLLNNFLTTIVGIAILFPVLSFVAGSPILPSVFNLVVLIIVAAVGMGILLRFGYVTESGIILALVIWGAFTFGAYTYGGLHDTSITGFLLVIVLAGIVGGRRTLFAFSGLAVFSLVGIYVLEQLEIVMPILYVPSDTADIALPIVVVIGTTLLLSTFVSYLTSANQKVQASANEITQANVELESSRDELAQQAQILERRTRYLEASAAVARDVAAELDPATLLERATTLITNQFDFYHTGVFLIDTSQGYAILHAASSQGGQHMLERGHQLKVGEEGIVGYVCGSGNSRIALDTGEDAVFFDNPDLPETRSEAAIPLRIGNEVIGALDVQSKHPSAFSQDDITVLQTLADQIGNALHTARLFQQVEENLAVQRRIYEETNRETWQRLTQTQRISGYQYIQGNVAPADPHQATESTPLPEIKVPIQLGDFVVGHIVAHKENQTDFWSNDDMAMMVTLSNQLSVALESARLYQDSQQRATREQITGEVTARIRETLDLDTILKTASDEIRKALNLPEVVIQLGEPPSKPTGGATK